MKKIKITEFKICAFAGVILLVVAFQSPGKTLIDYFLPMPIVKQLRTDKWGCAATGKRDICNGLEDTTNRSYTYWDGPIIKGPDNKYHMLASRWNQSGGHWDWLSSVGIHAVSESVMGPYVDKGMTWPSDQSGKGHNLTILQLKDGTYTSVVSDTRQGDFFTAPSLDGPWKFAGSISINANGFSKPSHIANLSMIIRPDDGKYMIVERGGQIMISNSGLTGPYLIQGNSVYNTVNLPNLEDPVLWYSGGYYHIVVNSWSEKKAYHLRSKDGIKNWTNQGLAFDPSSNFLRYTDGTVNHWTKIERPGVYIENGHITHWTFAVIDAEKEKDLGNDGHNSKVIIVPFNGLAFDGIIIPEHRDTIYNGAFDSGSEGWTLNIGNGNASGSVINGEYKLAIQNTGTGTNQIQLCQSGLILQKEIYYKVSFDAYAASNLTIDINVEMKDEPFTSYLPKTEHINCSTTKSTYSFTFKMEHPTDSSGQLGFIPGAPTETAFLDNISIRRVDAPTTVSFSGRSLKNTPFVLYEKDILRISSIPETYSRLSFSIYDLIGTAVFHSTIKPESKNSAFNISYLSKGMYTVVLKSGSTIIYSSKFLHK